MKGWMYRTAVAVKEAGERLRFPALIRLGISLQNRVSAFSVR